MAIKLNLTCHRTKNLCRSDSTGLIMTWILKSGLWQTRDGSISLSLWASRSQTDKLLTQTHQGSFIWSSHKHHSGNWPIVGRAKVFRPCRWGIETSKHLKWTSSWTTATVHSYRESKFKLLPQSVTCSIIATLWTTRNNSGQTYKIKLWLRYRALTESLSLRLHSLCPISLHLTSMQSFKIGQCSTISQT